MNVNTIEFVDDVDDVISNVRTLHKMGSGSAVERKFHFDRIFNAEHQVALVSSGEIVFAPVKWSGTKRSSPEKYQNRKHGVSTRYQSVMEKLRLQKVTETHPEHEFYYGKFLEYCNSFGFRHSSAGVPHSASRTRKFWVIQKQLRITEVMFPEEVEYSGRYFEGAKKTVSVNSYERNSHARAACIQYHKAQCQACAINFESMYGDIGKGFIHVHHKVPLHKIDDQYEVDPINDLIPVCPNCHAMIHRSDPMLTVEELAELIAQQKTKRP